MIRFLRPDQEKIDSFLRLIFAVTSREALAIPNPKPSSDDHFNWSHEFGRWGDSHYHYAALNFIDEQTQVYIDEIDAYIDHLHSRLTIAGNESRTLSRFG